MELMWALKLRVEKKNLSENFIDKENVTINE